MLTQLRWLKLNANRIEEIESIKGLVNVEILDLSNNKLDMNASLDSLAGLSRKCRILYLNGNRIAESLKPLANLNKLEQLFLSDNQLTSIDSLKGLTSLKLLKIANNKLENITILSNLNKLNRIDVSFNSNITDFFSLYKMPKHKPAFFEP